MSEREIDNELVKQVLKGDKEAFDVLVVKYQHKIIKLIHQFVDDNAMAMDIAQEAFINAYKALPKFKGDSAFYTWLYRISINTTKNYLKTKSRRPPDTDIDIGDAIILGRLKLDDMDNPDYILHCDELQKAVMSVVNTLPEELRTSIILREMGGLSYDEIAEVMDCPVGTVRSRIFRARLAVDQQLKPILKEKEGD